MKTRNWMLGIMAVIALIVVAIALVQQSQLGSGSQSASNAATSTATYKNTTFGYSLMYPNNLEEKEITPEFISVGAEQNGVYVAKADVAVLHAGISDPLPSFQDFILLAARLACQMRTAGRATTCTSMASSETFTTDSGLAGQKFYLNATLSGTGASTNHKRGPFFAFNVSSHDKEDKYAVLLVFPPSEISQNNVDQTVLEAVAKSIQLTL